MTAPEECSWGGSAQGAGMTEPEVVAIDPVRFQAAIAGLSALSGSVAEQGEQSKRLAAEIAEAAASANAGPPGTAAGAIGPALSSALQAVAAATAGIAASVPEIAASLAATSAELQRFYDAETSSDDAAAEHVTKVGG